MGAAESAIQDVGNAFEDVGRTIEVAVNDAIDFVGNTGAEIGDFFISVPRQLILLLQKPNRPLPVPATIPQQTAVDARTALGLDPNCYNFVFAGVSGSGKSSIINALRGVEDSSPDAAKVDEVECTTKLAKYVHPSNPYVVLWDQPGGGTQSHDSYNYFLDKFLYAFDTVIIISGRFTALDADIAKSCQAADVPVVFVRSKSDAAIDSRAHRLKLPKKDVKAGAKEAIISKVLTELPESLHQIPMFVVSARVIGGSIDEANREDYELDDTTLVQHVLKTATDRRG